MADDHELRQIVEKRVKSRRDALVDLVGFVIIAPVVWGIWLAIQPQMAVMPERFIALLFLALTGVTVVIGLVVLWQLYNAYVQPWLDDANEREIEREIERIKADMLYEKPKRSRNRLALSDDGELLDIVEDSMNEITEETSTEANHR